ncbi:MAG: site-specific integrase [Bacteroidetes bacterium]|nr:site-specific integrase [Bacteroidota bacterium]
MQDWSLTTKEGKRKYMTLEERQHFFHSVDKALKREQRPFALMLYWSGCRISEALAVQVQHIDYSEGGVRFNTLKRRRSDIYRFVPLPPSFLIKLDDVYNIKALQKQGGKVLEQRIWDFTRRCGANYIKRVMDTAGIEGVQATAKGLRHSFVIAHQQNRTPAHMIQKWAGWSTPAMLQVYGAAMGEEEKELAAALWK